VNVAQAKQAARAWVEAHVGQWPGLRAAHLVGGITTMPDDEPFPAEKDRLGRSLTHLIDTVRALDARGVGFKSLQEHIDTTTSGGKLIFHVFAALAEFERDLIAERTKAGLQAARARGRRGGRKHALTPKQIALAKSMKADPHNSIADICATLKISKRTLYRYTGEHHAETERR
jgi:DNA invertase Pin-like site-specific DNA recombinase